MSTKDIALGVSKAILNGEWQALDGMLLDKKGYIEFMQGMKNAMSDMTMEFTHSVEQGDQVSIRFVTRCRHTGNFMGAPATKKNLHIDGKVAQEWQATDLLGTLSQMGFGTLLAYAISTCCSSPRPKRRRAPKAIFQN